MSIVRSFYQHFPIKTFIIRRLHAVNTSTIAAQQPFFDRQYDVVVVGSGAGGMTAALCAHTYGLSAIVLEKSDKYGGTSAVSGGGVWIPCNDQIKELRNGDSFDEALTYMKVLTDGEVQQSFIEAFLRNAPEMIRFLSLNFDIKFQINKDYPDYFPDKPGGRPGGRCMEPVHVDARILGDALKHQRESYKNMLLMNRIAMGQVEANTMMVRKSGWLSQLLKLIGRYWFDIPWRYYTSRDRRLTMGQALVGSLRAAMIKKNIPLLLSAGLESLIEKDNRVIGVNLKHNGQQIQIHARHGVILACGGFESNQTMREQYLPKPTKATWTATPGINHGDGIRAGIVLGADLKFMDQVWGVPTVPMSGSNSQVGLFAERSSPGLIIVNQRGQRFVNEAAPYDEILHAIYTDHLKTNATVPCWLIFDATFRNKYPMGPLLPGRIQRDSSLPKTWLDTVYYKANSLKELAGKINVDFDGLNKSVANMTQYAKTGKDIDFGKGDNAHDRYWSDLNVKPNSCLAPIVNSPFYAIPIYPGDIGTKGGLVTNENARVLRADGSPIEGLYAIGNCSATVMGKSYAGPGATLGPAMTFAYIAARNIASRISTNSKSAENSQTGTEIK